MKQFVPEIPFSESPHQGVRPANTVIKSVIIHQTAGASMASSIEWSKNPESKASWHFIIDRDGSASQQVPLDKAAWHAGVAELQLDGKFYFDVNKVTIGIELCSQIILTKNDSGYLTSTKSPYKGPLPVHGALTYETGVIIEGWWEPYTEAQISKLEWLLSQLRSKGYGAAVDNLRGHNEIGRPIGRKIDPSPCFPWKRFGRSQDQLLVKQRIDSGVPVIGANIA